MIDYKKKTILVLTLFGMISAGVSDACFAGTPLKIIEKTRPAVSIVSDNKDEQVTAEDSMFSDIDTVSVITYAEKFIGARYVYGASGPKTFDCSGFTMFIMAKYGIKLPHSARSQSSYGTKVSRDSLKPGDLVFFATSGGRRISHVGIYIGEDNFIHAASKGVMINNLNQEYYDRRYVTAVRLIE